MATTGCQAGATQIASVSTLAPGARCITAAGADSGRLPAHRCGPATAGRWADIRPVATRAGGVGAVGSADRRSEEHTSELQSLMRISYAVFCLKKKINNNTNT